MYNPSMASSTLQHTHFSSQILPQQPFPQDQHSSPRATSHPWKSVFRLPNSSSKKVLLSGPSLALDTSVYPGGNATHPPITPTSSLTPNSFLSDPRSSYNSSNTHSSDSNPCLQSRHPFSDGGSHNRSYPPYQQIQRLKSVDALSSAPYSRTRTYTKSEKPRMDHSRNAISPRAKPQTADPSQASFPAPITPSKSKGSGALSPKSMGVSATRFIRRVASAPNVKGLFSMGSRPATRNGMLAPSDTLPPVPSLASSSLENGTDSLETVSSGSSRGRSMRLTHSQSSPTKSRVNNGIADSPGQVAFRRTYSSNSIKVRQVRRTYFTLSLSWTDG